MSVNSAISQSTNSSWFSRASRASTTTSGRSQMHWKLFRKEVLAPHHIRILDTIAGERIPEAIITWIEANRTNVGRFQKQKKSFRRQVANGRGFGSSALFPQEVLPSNDARPFLARCMVPTLSADALPEKVVGRAGSAVQKSGLSIPRPGLGCGFSSSAFAPEEVNCIPEYMLATGTTVHFESGSIYSGTALYCPFLCYERALSQHEYGLEIASNQCAVDGAWAVRSLQMLYARAMGEDAVTEETFMSPISFSCAIDNDVAVINYHWVDHAQTYCMAPVVKFDLTRDDHFDQLLVWTEAIGQWALTHLLPEVKKAISLLSDYVSSLPALVGSLKALENKKVQEEEGLMSALRLTYDNIPWRYETGPYSPISSSTASWGSPMINEAVFAKFEYPIIRQPSLPPLPGMPHKGPSSVCSTTRGSTKGVRFAASSPTTNGPKRIKSPPSVSSKASSTASSKQLTAPQYTQNGDLVLQKRVGHAMDEIRELHNQLAQMKQELSGSTMCLQNELSVIRKDMTCVIRKEKFVKQGRSPIRTDINHQFFSRNERRINFQKNVSVVTTPTDPTARPVHWPSPTGKVRTPSGLQNVLTVDTTIEAVSAISSVHSPQCSAPIRETAASPITIFSPTIINVTSPTYENVGALVRVPNHQGSVWSQVAATHVISALVPAQILRVLFIGCLVDYCMVAMSGGPTPTLMQYIARVLDSASY